MAYQITVIVPLRADDGAVARTVKSLDEQSLPYADFEVLLVDAGLSEGARQRLCRLETRRPNVRLLSVGADGSTDEVDVVKAAHGEIVLVLREGDVVLPQTLELLHRAAAEGDHAAVRARAVRGRDWIASQAGDPGLEPTGNVHDSVVAHRKTALLETWSEHGGFAGLTALQPAGAPTDLGVWDYLCIRRADDGEGPGTPDHEVVGAGARVEWRDTGFRLVATVTEDASSDLQIGGSVSGAVLLEHEDGIEVLVPVSPTDLEDGGVDYVADVDVIAAQGAGPLASGRWTVSLMLWSTNRAALLELGDVENQAGLVRDRLVGVTARKGRLLLDVGNVGASLRRLSTDGATVHETSQGTRLTVRLRDIHAVVPGTARGDLLLGRLRLPAEIHVTADDARLECFVSGLAGRYPIATQFGTPKPEATGLDLVVSGTGEIRVTATRPRGGRRKPAAPALQHGRGTASPSVVQRLGRRLPEPVKPTVRRLYGLVRRGGRGPAPTGPAAADGGRRR